MRFRIEGRVQGVCFRASTREQALALGLSGHVRNLPDGSVEVLACGEPGPIEALARWLQRGPSLARVDSLQRQDEAVVVTPSGFHTA